MAEELTESSDVSSKWVFWFECTAFDLSLQLITTAGVARMLIQVTAYPVHMRPVQSDRTVWYSTVMLCVSFLHASSGV